jgi:Uridine kinase
MRRLEHWSAPRFTLVEGFVKGDVIVIEKHHHRAAAAIVAATAARAKAKPGRFVVTVAGESGSGKSETAAALAERLLEVGLRSAILGQDDYFMLPPKDNDARRRRDPDWLGPDVEVRFDLLQANVNAVLEGAASIEKPVIDYAANSMSTENLNLAGVKVVIVEGTYVSLLRHVDLRVFIARDRLETMDHRRRRNRGGEARDPFIEEVLRIEHKIIAGHQHLADIIVTRDYDVIEAG